MDKNPAAILSDILARELTRLDEQSQKQALEGRQLKALETLVKAYSNFKANNITNDEDELDEVPTEELVAKLKGK